MMARFEFPPGLTPMTSRSFAQPITALSYVTVLAISARFLHEDLPPSRLAGVGLILAGVWLVSRTPAETAEGAAP